MASIIIFSTMWGWILHEWKGSSKKAHMLIAGGIATLILSTLVIGFRTYLKTGQCILRCWRLIRPLILTPKMVDSVRAMGTYERLTCEDFAVNVGGLCRF